MLAACAVTLYTGLEVIDVDLNLIRENEAKIFEAIQNLKDSVFGLKASYVPFCYTARKRGMSFDWEKYELFVDELCKCAEEVEGYTETIGERLREFYGIVIRFVDLFCPQDDRCFASFKKLALTVSEDGGSKGTLFDAIMRDYVERDELDDAFRRAYESFSAKIGGEDFAAFYRCEKIAVEHFIDRHELNCLRSSEETLRAIEEIQRATMRLQRDFSVTRKLGVSDDE